MAGPLEGVRIVEVSEVISGPLAVMILADQGADVIKVEPPKHGEELRQLVNHRAGMAALFASCNHGKRSIGVNLKDPDGMALVHDLVRAADVFVQNWRPGAAGRLGLGEEDLRAINPDLIYASITGYGDDGPYAERRGYDPIFQALTGYVAAQVNPEIPFPDVVRNTVVDKATSYAMAQAISAALFARERGAGGQHVKVAMLDAGLSFFWPDGMGRHTLVGDDVENFVLPGERYQLTATADGQIMLWMGTTVQTRDALRAVGRDDLADDPSQRGKASLTQESQDARTQALADGFASLPTAELYRRLVDLEIPAAPILSHEEVLADPQIVHNRAVIDNEHPVYGPFRRAKAAAEFSATDPTPSTPPPLYGEQTDEILGELGYSAERIAALRQAETVR